MKKRILFGFSAGLQEDVERYQGVNEIALEEGWHLQSIHEHFESTLTRLIRARAVDGVISDFISDAWLGDVPDKIPLVHAGRRGLSPRVASVCFDGRRMGEKARQHLEDCGCTHMLLWSPILDSELEAGFGRGQSVPVARTLDEVSSRISTLATGQTLGLFCASDFEARRALLAARRLGCEVPNQLCVLGVGDRFWDAVVAEHEISSIPLPQQRLGQEAARLLRERLRGDPPRHIVLPPGPVIARSSTLRPSLSDLLIRRVESIFLENLAHSPSMADLARRLGMSRRAFETAFKRQGGQTPYQCLLALRNREAQRLMRETTWPLTRIAETIGYPEPARFSAFFKKQNGLPPGRWRQDINITTAAILNART